MLEIDGSMNSSQLLLCVFQQGAKLFHSTNEISVVLKMFSDIQKQLLSLKGPPFEYFLAR